MGHRHDDQRPAVDNVDQLRRQVAELERTNERLREQVRAGSRQSCQDLIESMNDVVYTTDRAGILRSVSQATTRIMGFDPQEMIGTHYSRWMPKAESETLEATRSDALKGQRKTNRAMVHDKEGNEHHLEISIGPLVVDGRIEGTQGIIRDITARHQAERAVRKGEEMLRALFNAATESILLLDRQGTVLTLNETAARRFGKSPEELIGTRIADVGESVFPASAVEYCTRRISEVLHTRQAVRFEDERAGRCFDTSAHPVFDEHGNVQQIAIFGKDTTEQKRAEAEIRKLQQQVEFILGASKTGLDIIDRDFNLRYVDPAWQKIGGPYQGKKCYEYFHGTDRPCPECGIPKALETRQVVTYDGTLPQEGNRPIQVTTIPFQAEKGEWLVAEVNVDISERKQLEQRLRESEERYRTVVESAGETIAIVDAQGVFQFMNTTAGRRLGGPPADFIGKTMWDLFPKAIADRQAGTVRKVIDTATAVNTIVPSFVDGEYRWYNTTIEPLKDSVGKVTAALLVARDIHELKTAQQELEAYREKMIRAEHLASLGTLGAMLSHEMTQPLTVLRLSLQNALKTLEDAPPPATVLDDLQDGLAEIGQVAAIVQRFRDFARRTSNEVVGEVSLAAVAGKIVRLLEESARKARIVLEVHELEGLPSVRACDKDIEQIFFALVQNAIHASDGLRDHWLRISGIQRDDSLELRFADDCGGIPPEILGHVFEPFVTTKSRDRGTGLGLCVVERMVSQAGGQVRVDSQWGKGTTFLVSLPMRPAGTKSSTETGGMPWKG